MIDIGARALIKKLLALVDTKINNDTVASSENLGLVKSSTDENKVNVNNSGIMEVNSLSANKIIGAGDIITHDANEFATFAQGEKADTAIQSVKIGNNIKHGNTINFSKLDLKSELSFIEDTDSVVFSNQIKSQETTSNSENNVLTTKGYVDQQIIEKLAASDAMVYKGTVGVGGTVESLPTSNVVTGDSYKVIVKGTYASQIANIGDLFIAIVSNNVITWTLIPSGDDGNVIADNILTNNQLIIGKGNSGIGTFSVGTNNQILRVSGGVPVWTDETIDTYGSTDNSIVATSSGTYNRNINIEVNQVSTDKMIQGSNILIFNGGNAFSFANSPVVS